MDTDTNDYDVNAFKNLLKEQIVKIYGHRGNPIPQEKFLSHSWDMLGSFVHYQKNVTPLIHEAVKKYPDFTARGYTLLTILYGAFPYEPSDSDILNEFVDLLDKDLVEEEIAVSMYAKKCSKIGSYFPGLIEVLKGIEHVYGAEYFDINILPPTPYLAYAMFTLNNKDSIDKKYSHEEIYGKLAVLHGKMSKVFRIVNESNQNSAP